MKPIRITRRGFLGTAGIVSAAGVTGCAGSLETGRGSRIRHTATQPDPVFAQSVQITSLDTAGGQPQVYPAGYEGALAIYSGLVRFDATLAFVPDLATRWSVAADRRTWTFHLRRGVRFHDGTDFDADAVVSYFTHMLDPNYNLAAYTLWEPIKRIVKIDSGTVRIITAEPYGALLNTLAHASALIPSPAAVRRYGKDIGLHPVGTGAYRLVDFTPGNRLVVAANHRYYGPKPLYRQISYSYVPDPYGRVAALQSGQVDLIDDVPVEQAKYFDGPGGMGLVNVPGLQCFGIGLNHTNRILADVRIRRALNHAIDTEAIVTALFRGYATPLSSPLAPNTNGYSNCGHFDYDPARAGRMLSAAGARPGSDGVRVKDGERLSFRLRTPDGMYPNDTSIAQVVQEQLRTIGVEVHIQKVDKSTFWDGITVPRAKVDFDLVLFGYNPSHGSGALQLDALYLTNPSAVAKPRQWNFNWYSNSEVDAKIHESETAVDATARDRILARAQHLIWNDAPYIWLFTKNNLAAYDAKVATPVVLPLAFTLPSSQDPGR